LQALHPSAEHLTDLIQTFRKQDVLLIIDSADIPENLQKEFRDVEPRICLLEVRQLLFLIQIACDEKKLRGFDQRSINLCTERVAEIFLHMRQEFMPSLVRTHEVLDNGKRVRCRGGFTVCILYMKKLYVEKLEKIASAENLLEAWREFVTGKRGKHDLQEFQLHLMDNILALHTDLMNGTYRHGGYEAFNISDPKPRSIHKATVRDRLVHHAIYRQLYPFFDKTFVADSFSCRNGKGTHAAMDRFRSFARSVSKNNTRTCWVLKGDIRKFFASVDQASLIEILKSYIPDRNIIALLEEVIGSFSTRPGIGLPLGNLTSQLFVNIYMNEFDQFMKHTIRAKQYLRYADDFMILASNREWLQIILPEISNFLFNRLRLALHPKKVSIKTLASGIDVLGWVHFPNHRVLRTTTKRRAMSRVITDPNPAHVASYLGMLKHGNAEGIRKTILESVGE
jgi:RNA-directed DNA polymerase